ncbi:MAG: hypothetical protein MR877_09805 [Spirochaetia bacterium]|nr:hypothetical protein [Spirochaetia bacterium]
MIINGKNYSEKIKNQLTQNSKNIDERFFGNNSFSLVSLCNRNIQGFSAYYKISNSLCEIFLYISPELIDQPEEIRLFEKLISVARGNGFETLKVCLEHLTEHEMNICKRKGFREETSSDTQTVLCKHI